jgi:hypothetical protein
LRLINERLMRQTARRSSKPHGDSCVRGSGLWARLHLPAFHHTCTDPTESEAGPGDR